MILPRTAKNQLLPPRIGWSLRAPIRASSTHIPRAEGGGGRWVNKNWASNAHIGIVGCGGVGTACASSLIHRGRSVARTITLYDRDTARCRGEVLDLGDQAGFHGARVRLAETVAGLRGCDVIVIAAGAKCRPGEARSALAVRNAAMLQDLVRNMVLSDVFTPQTIVVVATNPVDALTALVARWLASKVSPNQIIGSGTYIDSQRLRVLLSKRLHVPPRTVHAYVLGEHGDSQTASYDMVTVGAGSLRQCGMGRAEFAELAELTRRRAQQIVLRKGNTRHCVGECVAAICQAVLQDTHDIVPVSALVPTFGCVFGWPSVLGRTGIEQVLPVHLSADEHAHLLDSSVEVKRILEGLSLEFPMAFDS